MEVDVRALTTASRKRIENKTGVLIEEESDKLLLRTHSREIISYTKYQL